MPALVRLSAVLALVGAVLVGPGPVSSATAAPTAGLGCMPTPSRSDPATVSLANARHISPAMAATRITWQQNAPAVADQMAIALGGSYGGTWIAQDGTDRVEVGIVGAAAGSVRAAAVRAGRRCPVGAVTVVPVAHSAGELAQVTQWLATHTEPGAGSARARGAGLTIGIDLAHSRVDVALPRTGLSPAQGSALAQALTHWGSAISLETSDGHPVQAAAGVCAGNYCIPPLRGGVEIDNFLPDSSYEFCTLGLIMRDPVTSTYYALTAGHCSMPGSLWQTRFANGLFHKIGVTQPSRTFGAAGDYELISITNPSGWKPGPYIYQRPSAGNPGSVHQPVTGYTNAVQGSKVCQSGRTTGTNCGTVELTDVAVFYTSPGAPRTLRGMVQTNYCGDHGDSGAPVFAGTVAYGINSGGELGLTSNCTSYYMPIKTIISRLRVVPAVG
jgi:hypothetical protein